MRSAVIESILKNHLIAIVRGLSRENVLRTADALARGGVKLMEVTYNAADASAHEETAATIAALRRAFDGALEIGAGTVLTKRQVDLTREAGGRFIISPNVDPDVIGYTVESGLVSIPGAMTPTECALAQKSGADFVKLFPIGNLGASYLKAIAAPLSHIRFLAVGGVKPEEMKAYAAAGAVGFGAGGDLILPSAIREGKPELVAARAAEYMRAVREAYGE